MPCWMDKVIKVVQNRWIWEETAVSFLESSPLRWNPRGIVRFHGMKGISLNDERWPGSGSPSWRKLGPFARWEWRKKARKLRVSWASKIPLMRIDGKDFCHLWAVTRFDVINNFIIFLINALDNCTEIFQIIYIFPYTFRLEEFIILALTRKQIWT